MAEIDGKLRGIPKITIPVNPEEFIAAGDGGVSVVLRYFAEVMSAHRANQIKIGQLWRFYLGVQDIANKIRPYNNQNNNRISENHAFEFVEIKTALFDANNKQFSKRNADSSDDIAFLNRYLIDCGYYAKNIEADRFACAVGVGVTFSAPNVGRIFADDFDSATESPFVFDWLNPKDNFVVYSSFLGKEPLFCVNIEAIRDVYGSERTVYTVWTRHNSFRLDESYRLEQGSVKVNAPLGYLPMTERSINAARLGIIELVQDEFNFFNTLVSSSADSVVDNANAILVFQDVEIDADDIVKMLEAGAIKIPPPANYGQGRDTKVYKVDLSFKINEVSDFLDKAIVRAYAVAGIPVPSSNTTSGGDTGQSSEIRSGWETASLRTKLETNSLIACDYKQLKLFLAIAKAVPDNKLDGLAASEIDVKYVIKYNDNPLVRAQAFDYYMKYMPPEMALDKSGSSMDSHSDGAAIEAWMEKQERKAAEKETVATESRTAAPESQSDTAA